MASCPYAIDSTVFVLSPSGCWRVCSVKKIDSAQSRVLIHYQDFDVQFDEWIPWQGSRITWDMIAAHPLGQTVSILSPTEKLRRCKVLKHDMSNQRFLIHYIGFNAEFDEWVDYSSQRIGACAVETYPVNARIHVLSKSKAWRCCTVLEHNADSRCFRIHYNNYDCKFDEWISYGSHRIGTPMQDLYPIGSHLRVLSPTEVWRNCVLLLHDADNACLKVHYEGFDSKHDEWIDYGESRIGPNLDESHPDGSTISILSPSKQWRECSVLRHDPVSQTLLVHYNGFSSDHDEWIGYMSDRIAPEPERSSMNPSSVEAEPFISTTKEKHFGFAPAQRSAESASTISQGRVSPQDIKYCQDSISILFRRCGRTIYDTLGELQSGKLSVDEIPTIDVFQWNGGLFSADNRRLWVFKKYGEPINVRRVALSSINKSKLTTVNGGSDIRLRP